MICDFCHTLTVNILCEGCSRAYSDNLKKAETQRQSALSSETLQRGNVQLKKQIERQESIIRSLREEKDRTESELQMGRSFFVGGSMIGHLIEQLNGENFRRSAIILDRISCVNEGGKKIVEFVPDIIEALKNEKGETEGRCALVSVLYHLYSFSLISSSSHNHELIFETTGNLLLRSFSQTSQSLPESSSPSLHYSLLLLMVPVYMKELKHGGSDQMKTFSENIIPKISNSLERYLPQPLGTNSNRSPALLLPPPPSSSPPPKLLLPPPPSQPALPPPPPIYSKTLSSPSPSPSSPTSSNTLSSPAPAPQGRSLPLPPPPSSQSPPPSSSLPSQKELYLYLLSLILSSTSMLSPTSDAIVISLYPRLFSLLSSSSSPPSTLLNTLECISKCAALFHGRGVQCQWDLVEKLRNHREKAICDLANKILSNPH